MAAVGRFRADPVLAAALAAGKTVAEAAKLAGADKTGPELVEVDGSDSVLADSSWLHFENWLKVDADNAAAVHVPLSPRTGALVATATGFLYPASLT